MTEPTICDLLDLLVPPEIAVDLAEHLDDLVFVAEQVKAWIAADESTRRDILAFHRSGGPELVERAKVNDEPPEADELERWMA